jgi:hypothetical protein
MDPDPAIFVIDLQDASKKLIYNTIFSAYYFLKVHLHHFSKIKSQKESQNSRNQGFSYYFCMMIEGSGSGSIPLTTRSGSGRPKNIWIRWIRIRIRNTELCLGLGLHGVRARHDGGQHGDALARYAPPHHRSAVHAAQARAVAHEKCHECRAVSQAGRSPPVPCL